MEKGTEEKNDLPVVIEQGKDLTPIEKGVKNVFDISRRILKISGGIAGMFASTVLAAGVSAIGGPSILSTAALVGAAVFGAKGVSNVVLKKEPGIMFTARKNAKDGSILVEQDPLQYPSYLRGISLADKAGIMGLQTLVGFQRYKIDLKSAGAESFEKNGRRVYNQEYSTITHSVNLNNLRALEKAGYIEIVNEETDFYKSPIEKITGKPKHSKKSLLILEKMGFANIKALKDVFRAVSSGDKSQVDSLKESMEKITFRLTDKEFDFEDIYKKVNGYVEYESQEERDSLKRLRSIFYDSNNRIPGVLSGRRFEFSNDNKKKYYDRKCKIDIEYDKFRRPILKYGVQKSFGEKIEESLNIQRIDRNIAQSKKEAIRFSERLRKDVTIPETPLATTLHQNNPETKQVSSDEEKSL